MTISHGMNRIDLDRCLRALGGEVQHVSGTGDIRYSHGAISARPRANSRRKDAPRALTIFVMKVAEFTQHGGGHD